MSEKYKPEKYKPAKSKPAKYKPEKPKLEKSKEEEPTSEKLQKVLARLGYGSRRKMEVWISEGRVRVNKRIAKLGDRVSEDDALYLDDKEIDLAESKIQTRVILYHKPVGEICSHDDRRSEGSVFDNLPRLHHGRWVSVGRLDVSSSGLLLLTNDGDLANKLMHPSSQIAREYSVRVLGEASRETMQLLTKGVELEDGMARFEHIVPRDSSGVNHWYYVVVTEGRNRLVRRLWESQGLKVNRLKRVRYGPIILGSMPKQGCYRDLSAKEIRQLKP